jgi:hypothetical protein
MKTYYQKKCAYFINGLYWKKEGLTERDEKTSKGTQNVHFSVIINSTRVSWIYDL